MSLVPLAEFAFTSAWPPPISPVLIAYAESSWTTGTTKTTGTLTWRAGDQFFVLGVTTDNATAALATPTATGLTFTPVSGTPTNVASSCKGYAWVATAATDQLTPTAVSAVASGVNGTHSGIAVWQYRASLGLGNVAVDVSGAKTAALGRQLDRSAVVGLSADWSAAVTTGFAFAPVAGATNREATQDGSSYTIYVADWPDQGTSSPPTTAYGITGTASVGTHTKVVLEVLGSAAGPAGRSLGRPVRAQPAAVRGGRVQFRAGVLSVVAPTSGPPVRPLDGPVRSPVPTVRGGRSQSRAGVLAAAPTSGPPVRALDGPVRAPQLPARSGVADGRAGTLAISGPPVRALDGPVAASVRVLSQRGRIANYDGSFGGAGPAVRPLDGPVAAPRPAPARGGRVASRAGSFTATAPTSGPPVRLLDGPVQARWLPTRGGRTGDIAGPYAGTGPALRPAAGPVRAQAQPARGGRVLHRAGVATAVAPQVGPPVYPLGHPVQARRLPARGGWTLDRPGIYAGTGPQAPQLRQPVARGRQQPPPPARGRIQSQDGTRSGLGPPVRPLRGPVRARLPGPVRTGRADSTLLPAVAVLVTSGAGVTGVGPGGGYTAGGGTPSATGAGAGSTTGISAGQSRTEAPWQSSSVTGPA